MTLTLTRLEKIVNDSDSTKLARTHHCYLVKAVVISFFYNHASLMQYCEVIIVGSSTSSICSCKLFCGNNQARNQGGEDP